MYKEVNKGSACASVAVKYSIFGMLQKNWIKKENQIYESTDSNLSEKKGHGFYGSPYENLDTTWLHLACKCKEPIYSWNSTNNDSILKSFHA